jgi:ubiquinone/menaquinone biosynthesis C-methylase UbiE
LNKAKKKKPVRKPYRISDLSVPGGTGTLKNIKRLAGIPMILPEDMPEDMKMSIKAWNIQWAKLKGEELKASREEYYRDYMDDTLRQVLSWVDPARHRRYLEIGCGPGFLGVEIAKRGFDVAGLDCCVEALKVASKVYKEAGEKSFLLGGDLSAIPLKDNSVDFLYGGGVIEHFRDTTAAVRELGRVLSPGGVSFNTVPYFSISSLTYRQIWGNIPDVPVLRPLFEWFHMSLLGGGHMTYGYEKSFTASKMRKIHLDAGFSQVHIRRFDVFLPLYFAPGPLKPLIRAMCRYRPFWPMIAVVGIK